MLRWHCRFDRARVREKDLVTLDGSAAGVQEELTNTGLKLTGKVLVCCCQDLGAAVRLSQAGCATACVCVGVLDHGGILVTSRRG